MIRIFLPLICAALGLAAASCDQSEGPLAPPAEAPASPPATSHEAASAAMASPPDSAQTNGAGGAVPLRDSPPAVADQTAPAALKPAASSPGQGSTPSDSPPSAPQSASGASPDAPTSTLAQRRASTLIGMPVTSAEGTPLGEVKDIIFDPQGRATHIVIAYDTEPGAGPEEIPEGKPRPRADGKLTAIPWDAAVASIKEGRLVLDDAKLQGAPSFTPEEWPNLDDPAWSATADAYWRKVARPAVATHPGTSIDSTARLRARPARDGD